MSTFLSAEWRRLVMLNYPIDPTVLEPWLPKHTELDIWNGVCYVSLIGFMFQKTKIKGFSIPFHINFEEVNLRFYVRYQDPELGWKRGVVFIRELVPKPAIVMVANGLYRERYLAVTMAHDWKTSPEGLAVNYSWRQKGRRHNFGVETSGPAIDMIPGSEAEFITEHYWGYAQWDAQRTMQYQVDHPRWQIHPIKNWHCAVDFALAYGDTFAFLNDTEPSSVFLAEGSPVTVNVGALIE
jgi:uncharacterized protein YqjF (DUF2071 family)